MVKIVLLGNQPERMPRLKLFEKTLKSSGYEVIVPTFKTRNWITISREASLFIKKAHPDIVHIFNVPDIIYRNIPKLKGKYYEKLIYDYRCPWGIGLQIMFNTRMARHFGEYYEKKLARAADVIATTNTPHAKKIREYTDKPIYIIPNYPSSDFLKVAGYIDAGENKNRKKIVLFVGMICKKEGSNTLKRIIANLKKNTDIMFWIVGDGPDRKNLQNDVKNYENVKFFGWQPHEKIPLFIKQANICLALLQREYSLHTDKDILKINEYLNCGMKVVASGISKEEERKNLIITSDELLEEVILSEIEKPAKKLDNDDFRLWELHSAKIIEKMYDKILF